MLLIDMEMPTCCAECPMLDDNGDYPMCRVNQAQHGYTFSVNERRMPECPLYDMERKENPCDVCQEWYCDGCKYQRGWRS